MTRDEFTKMMMEEGEYPFTQEEVDEMMHIAVDTITGQIPYEYYINQIMVRELKFSFLLLNKNNI